MEKTFGVVYRKDGKQVNYKEFDHMVDAQRSINGFLSGYGMREVKLYKQAMKPAFYSSNF